MQSSYHSTPADMRLKMPHVPLTNIPKSSQERLALMQPPSARKKYWDMFLDKGIFAAFGVIIGTLGTWAVFHFLLHTV
jgi:hypothetical protein